MPPGGFGCHFAGTDGNRRRCASDRRGNTRRKTRRRTDDPAPQPSRLRKGMRTSAGGAAVSSVDGLLRLCAEMGNPDRSTARQAHAQADAGAWRRGGVPVFHRKASGVTGKNAALPADGCRSGADRAGIATGVVQPVCIDPVLPYPLRVLLICFAVDRKSEKTAAGLCGIPWVRAAADGRNCPHAGSAAGNSLFRRRNANYAFRGAAFVSDPDNFRIVRSFHCAGIYGGSRQTRYHHAGKACRAPVRRSHPHQHQPADDERRRARTDRPAPHRAADAGSV